MIGLYRHLIKGAVVLLPLLGLTWIFGVFAIDSNTTVFAWIFTVLNSLQVNKHKRDQFICYTFELITIIYIGSIHIRISCSGQQKGKVAY